MATVIHWVNGTASTAGATAATVASFDLSSAGASPTGVAFDNCSVEVEATLTGYVTSGTAGAIATRKLTRAVKRVSGTVSTVGALTNLTALLSDAALALVALDIDVSGNVIRLRATGVAGETITWFGDMKIRINQP